LAIGVLALVLLDFLPPKFDLTVVEGRPVDRWLRQQTDGGAVAQFPFGPSADSQEQIYYTLIHQKPYIGALYGSFQTSQFVAIRPVLEKFPSRASIELLQEMGVRYVVVDGEWYDSLDAMDDVHIALSRQGARRLVVLGGMHVYRLP
jgi:hypothetical protein